MVVLNNVSSPKLGVLQTRSAFSVNFKNYRKMKDVSLALFAYEA